MKASGRPAAAVALISGLIWSAGAAATQESQTDYRARIQKERDARVSRLLNGDFSPLKKVGTHRLPDAPRVTVGSGPEADIRIQGQGIAPVHIVLEGTSETPTLHAAGGRVFFTWDNSERTNWTLQNEFGFRMGQYNIQYWVNPQRRVRTLQVFDPEAPARKRFKGLEYFPVDPAFRVQAQIEPATDPERVQLLDSSGREQTFWVYGHLGFALGGVPSRLELYSESLDAKVIAKTGFNLMFTDATSGKESYPAARYLSVEGRTHGTVTVDFNRAVSPPCVFSPLYSCPFPRKQNRLPVAIRAGEKWYRDPGK